MADDRLDVLVFFSPSCSRCKRIHAVVEEARKSVGSLAKFSYMNCKFAHVRDMVAPRYKVTRIPSIVVCTKKSCDTYFVGVPDVKDLVGMISYLYVHPEGGHGLEA